MRRPSSFVQVLAQFCCLHIAIQFHVCYMFAFYTHTPTRTDNQEACSMLLSNGADPKAKDNDGLTGSHTTQHKPIFTIAVPITSYLERVHYTNCIY